MAATQANTSQAAAPTTSQRTPFKRIAAWYVTSPSAVWGAVLATVLALAAIAAPIITPYEPETMHYEAVLAGPSLTHPFGTDNFGRDVLARVLYGYQISLGVAFGSVGLALIVGVPLGLLAGFFGGLIDNLIMRPMDVLLAFPAVVLVVALAGFLGRDTGVMILAMGVVYTPIIVRVMRGATLEVAGELFVEGARARGASSTRLLFRHVLPNAITPVSVQATILLGLAILLEAALSFIGLGTQPPTPSLGLMLSEGRNFMTQAPWIVVMPGIGITLAVIAFNMLGSGLQEVLNPARQGR